MSSRRELCVGKAIAAYAQKARRSGRKLGRSESAIGRQIAAYARKLRQTGVKLCKVR